MDLQLIIRTSLLLALAALLTRLLHKAAPATRHLVWHAAIVVVIMAPLLMPVVPAIRVPMVPEVPRVPKVLFENGVTAAPNLPPSTVGTVSTAGTLGTAGTVGTISTLGTMAVASWFLFCWLLSGLSATRGSRPARSEWVAEARTVADRIGLRDPITVRETLKDGSPHVAGLFRSVVMMPPSAAAWTSQERQAALVHELTHIRRGDRRTQALAQLACAIYWFNPLVWHAAAGLARERERACDDEVLRVGVKPSAYAALLLDLARRPAAWAPATALSMARPSAIEGRLVMILGNVARVPRRSTRWLIGAGGALCATAVLGAQPAATAVPVQSPAAAPAAIIRPQAVMQLDAVPAAGLTEILVQALSDADRQVREQAALGLALTPGDAVIDPLLAALRDRDSQVREKAAIGLAFRRDPRIVDPLLQAITDEDGQVREKAAIALGASGDARAVEALKKATADPDPQVREKAIAGLVLLGLRR